MTISRFVVRLNCLSFFLVALLIIFTQLSGLKVSDLFFHPYFSPNPNVALLTRTFQILCSVPVIVCTFTYGLAQSIQPRTKQPRTSENRFILFSAFLTGGFLLNEIYRIHIYGSSGNFQARSKSFVRRCFVILRMVFSARTTVYSLPNIVSWFGLVVFCDRRGFPAFKKQNIFQFTRGST
jgi:hypothetical protein